MAAAQAPGAARQSRPRLTLIVARGRNGVIGRGGGMPWHLPEDLKFFRATTTGHPILMGRTTHESIGRPLPGRRNLVLSRDPGYAAPGCETVASLADALARCEGCPELFVIGGAQVYALALPQVDRMIVTEIDAEFDGDVCFPAVDPAAWVERRREPGPSVPGRGYSFAWVYYDRAAAAGTEVDANASPARAGG